MRESEDSYRLRRDLSPDSPNDAGGYRGVVVRFGIPRDCEELMDQEARRLRKDVARWEILRACLGCISWTVLKDAQGCGGVGCFEIPRDCEGDTAYAVVDPDTIRPMGKHYGCGSLWIVRELLDLIL